MLLCWTPINSTLTRSLNRYWLWSNERYERLPYSSSVQNSASPPQNFFSCCLSWAGAGTGNWQREHSLRQTLCGCHEPRLDHRSAIYGSLLARVAGDHRCRACIRETRPGTTAETLRRNPCTPRRL